jgi:hypothetical protein
LSFVQSVLRSTLVYVKLDYALQLEPPNHSFNGAISNPTNQRAISYWKPKSSAFLQLRPTIDFTSAYEQQFTCEMLLASILCDIYALDMLPMHSFVSRRAKTYQAVILRQANRPTTRVCTPSAALNSADLRFHALHVRHALTVGENQM